MAALAQSVVTGIQRERESHVGFVADLLVLPVSLPGVATKVGPERAGERDDGADRRSDERQYVHRTTLSVRCPPRGSLTGRSPDAQDFPVGFPTRTGKSVLSRRPSGADGFPR